MGEPLRLPIYKDPQPAVIAEVVEDLSYPKGVVRPKVRADCLKGGSNEVRPCPFATCKWHLYEEMTSRGRENEVDISTMKHSCALDVADAGGTTLEEIGELLGLTRERIRQIESKIMYKLHGRKALRNFRD